MKRWYAIGPVATVDDPVEGSYQCAPDGCVGWIDTRPIGDIAAGFFAFDTRPDHLKETHDLIGDGTRLDEYHPTLAERAAWASAYAVTVNPTDTLLQMLVALLTDQADPDGYERCRPLTVDHRGNYEIHLGGHSRIYHSKFRGENDRLWPNLQRLWQVELRKTHAAEAKRGAKDPNVQTGKMLAELARLHKCPAELLTPKELKGLKPRTPTTTRRDDFNRANGELSAAGNATWGGVDQGWGWTQVYNGTAPFSVATNALAIPYTFSRYSADAPLSSANHYAETAVLSASQEYSSPGVHLRKDATAMQTYYTGFCQRWDSRVVFRRFVNGGYSQLFMSTTDDLPQYTLRAAADGSTLTLMRDGVTVLQGTDTAIASGFYTGIGGRYNDAVVDDFVTRDLLAAGIPPELLGMRAV